jgi:hypothetical protein
MMAIRTIRELLVRSDADRHFLRELLTDSV